MPTFDFIKQSNVGKTYRTEMVRGSFDLKDEKVTEHFAGNIAIEGKQWKIGLICGGSGTGKTTIAREVFGVDAFTAFSYGNHAVIDEMPQDANFSDVTKVFTAVGFATVPSWLKPFDVLSNGEKMRVDLARMLLDHKALSVVDEFTSVVDRRVAQTASVAMSKAIRRMDGKEQFVFLSCHKDIVEWLQPDWIYDTDERRFFFTLLGNGLESQSKYTNCMEGQMQSRHFGSALSVITI